MSAAGTAAAAKPPRKRKRGVEHTEPHGHETFSAVVSLGRDKEGVDGVCARLAKVRNTVLQDWDEDAQLIVDTMVKCVRGLPTRLPAYSALTVLCAAKLPAVGDRVCAACAAALRGALASGDWTAAKAFLRYFALLSGDGAVPVDAVAGALRGLLRAAAADTTDLAARQDTLAYVALSVLPWLARGGGGGAAAAAALLDEAQGYLARRKRSQSLHPFRPVEAQPYNYIQDAARRTAADPADAIDVMWAELKGLRDGGWDLAGVLPEFAAAGVGDEERRGWSWGEHGLIAAAAPAHDAGLTYADLPSMLHIFARWDDAAKKPRAAPENGGDTEIAEEDVAALDARLATPLGDRAVLREYVGDLLYSCNASKETLALQLRALPCRGNDPAEAAALVVEVLLGHALALPCPRYPLVYYTSLLADLCKGKESPYAVALVEALDVLHDGVVTLDAELADRLLKLLAFQLSNYSLKWLWDDWVDVLRSAKDADQRTATCRKLFIFEIFTQLARHADRAKVTKAVPKPYERYVPKDPEPRLGFRYTKQDVPLKREADALLLKVRIADFSADDAVKQLAELGDKAAAPERAEMLLQCILFNGSDYMSHERVLFQRFAPALRQLAEGDGRADVALALVRSVNTFWDCGTPATGSVCAKVASLQHLLDFELVTPHDVVRWLGTPEITELLERVFIWELVDAALSHLAARAVAGAEELIDLEGAAAELAGKQLDEKMKAKVQAKLDKAVQKQASLLQDTLLFDLHAAFRTLFTTLRDALKKQDEKERKELAELHQKAEAARAAGTEPPKSNMAGKNFIWRRAVLGHLTAAGRRYLPFLLPFVDELQEEVFVRGAAPAAMLNAFYDWRLLRGRRALPERGTFSGVEGPSALRRAALARIARTGVGGRDAGSSLYDRLDAGKVDLASLLPDPAEEPAAPAAAAAPPAAKGAAEAGGDGAKVLGTF